MKLDADSLAAELYAHLVRETYSARTLGDRWIMNQEWYDECRNLATQLGAYQHVTPGAEMLLLGFAIDVRDDGGVPQLREAVMSIWSSISGETVRAITNDGDDINYRGEGMETLTVDVATAHHFHDKIRLAIWGDNHFDSTQLDALLAPAAALELARKLTQAAQSEHDPG